MSAAVSLKPDLEKIYIDQYKALISKIPADFLVPCLKSLTPSSAGKYEPLPLTWGRKVVALRGLATTTFLFLTGQVNPLHLYLGVIPDDATKAMFDDFQKIPGIEVLPRVQPTDPMMQCDHYIFQNEAWYQALFSQKNSLTIHAKLFTSNAITYLESQGYKRIAKPEVGSIIVYMDKGEPRHFGRVHAINEKGVIIESSFLHYFTARHPKEMVPISFGDEIVFMKKGEAPASVQDAKKS